MDYELTTLGDYMEMLNKKPFTFSGEKHLIVPKRFVDDKVFEGVEKLSALPAHDLGELEEIPYLSNIDLRSAGLFHLYIGDMFNSRIGSLHGLSEVGDLLGSSVIEEMHGSSRIGSMRDSSIVVYMYDFSIVGHMGGLSRVENTMDSAKIVRDCRKRED